MHLIKESYKPASDFGNPNMVFHKENASLPPEVQSNGASGSIARHASLENGRACGSHFSLILSTIVLVHSFFPLFSLAVSHCSLLAPPFVGPPPSYRTGYRRLASRFGGAPCDSGALLRRSQARATSTRIRLPLARSEM
jgi:hypothetical protein